MNILCIQVHTPFFYALANALSEHIWFFVPSSYTLAWGPERPLPPNCHPITWEVAKGMIRKGEIDLYIISTLKQFMTQREDLPTIYIEHNYSPKIGEYHNVDDPSVIVMWKELADKTFRKVISPDGSFKVEYRVFPTYASFDALPYKGDKKQVLSVFKGMSIRPVVSRLPLWEEVTKDFPTVLAGRYNEDVRGNIGYADYEAIRKLYSESRVYFSTAPFWYMTATQEAFFTGMPVVILDRKAPFRNNKEVIKEDHPEVLKVKIKELLENKDKARRIGAKGREAYLKLLDREKVRKVWNEAFEEAILLYKERKKTLEGYRPLDFLLKNTNLSYLERTSEV